MRPQLEQMLVWATPGQRGFTDAMRQAANPAYAMVQPPPLPLPSAAPKPNAAPLPARSAAVEAQARAQLEARQKAVSLALMLKDMEKVSDDDRRSKLLDAVCSKEDILVRQNFHQCVHVQF